MSIKLGLAMFATTVATIAVMFALAIGVERATAPPPPAKPVPVSKGCIAQLLATGKCVV